MFVVQERLERALPFALNGTRYVGLLGYETSVQAASTRLCCEIIIPYVCALPESLLSASYCIRSRRHCCLLYSFSTYHRRERLNVKDTQTHTNIQTHKTHTNTQTHTSTQNTHERTKTTHARQQQQQHVPTYRHTFRVADVPGTLAFHLLDT